MKKTGRLIYAASERCSNLRYLTGFSAPDPFLWFEINGKPTMVVSSMELERARKQAHSNIRILSFDQAREQWSLGKAPGTAANFINAISAQERIQAWTVPGDFPLSLAEAVAHAGRFWKKPPQILCAKGDFCPKRVCKSHDEVEMLRHSERIAEAGLRRATDILRQAAIGQDQFLYWNGELLTAEILQGEINAEIARQGGTASGTIAAPGIQASDPHQQGHGPVPANQPIVFDIFPQCDATGYFGDLSRTLLKGKASGIVRKAFDAVYDAQRTVIQTLKAGVTGKEAHDLAAQTLRKHGFHTDSHADIPYGFIHSTGHSLGLDIHESPGLHARNTAPLLPGMVLSVEPGLYYPEWGGVRIEDIVCITEDGCDDLAAAPVFLEIE